MVVCSVELLSVDLIVPTLSARDKLGATHCVSPRPPSQGEACHPLPDPLPALHSLVRLRLERGVARGRRFTITFFIQPRIKKGWATLAKLVNQSIKVINLIKIRNSTVGIGQGFAPSGSSLTFSLPFPCYLEGIKY